MSTSLSVVSNAQLSVAPELAANFLPIFTTDTALQRYQAFKDFVKGVLKEGVDFGKVPGSDRDTLLKPGAEKLCTFFGLTPRYVPEVVIEDWRGDEYGQPLFYYRYKCQLFRGDFQMGEGIGSCSSWEAKYRYRWVDESTVNRMGLDKNTLIVRGGAISEFEFALSKKETSGQYGKPAEYWAKWQQAMDSGRARKIQKMKKDGTTSPAYEMDMTMYRVPNTEFADIINTVQKIGQKRAYVCACLSATNASDYFTQDAEDYIDAETIPSLASSTEEPNRPAAPAVVTKPPAAKVQQMPSPAPRTAPGTESSNGPVGVPGASQTSTNVPKELNDYWQRMKMPDGHETVFRELKAKLIEQTGEDEGNRQYRAILENRNAHEKKSLANDARADHLAVKDLFVLVHTPMPEVVA